MEIEPEENKEINHNTKRWCSITIGPPHTLPPPRAAHSTSTVGDKVYLFGGFLNDKQNITKHEEERKKTYFNDIHVADFSHGLFHSLRHSQLLSRKNSALEIN